MFWVATVLLINGMDHVLLIILASGFLGEYEPQT
jgi:hypothetical protein